MPCTIGVLTPSCYDDDDNHGDGDWLLFDHWHLKAPLGNQQQFILNTTVGHDHQKYVVKC